MKKILICMIPLLGIVLGRTLPQFYYEASEKKELENYVEDMEEVIVLEDEVGEKLNSYLNNPTENAQAEVERAYEKWRDMIDKVGDDVDDYCKYNPKIKEVHSLYRIYDAAFSIYIHSGYSELDLQSCVDVGEDYYTQLKDLVDEYGVDADHLFE